MATRKLEVVITGGASQLEKTLGRVSDQASGFGGAMKKAAIPAAAALGALAVGAKTASDSASNLNESVNAVTVVFGEAASKVLDFSEKAAKQAGLSMRDFNELVTPVGASLQNVGFSAGEAADASINLAKRAADMASVFNVDVSEALEAIQSGLRGEADPLERFGVGLSDAAVKAKAMTMGLAQTEKALTANDKAQARLALIMEQTNKVAGDFVNTSGSLANRQRINAAETENQTAKLGQGLLPVMEMFQKLLASTTAFLGEHTTATKVAVGIVASLAAGVLAVNAGMAVYRTATVAATAAQAAFNLVLSANPIGVVIIAIAALAAGMVIAYNKSETFRDIVDGVWRSIKRLGDWIQDNWGTISKIIENSPIVLSFRAWKKVIEEVIDRLDDLVGKIRSVISWLGKIDFPSVPGWLDPRNLGDPRDPTFTGPSTGFTPGLDVSQGSVNLKGARPEMMPFAQAGAAFGLAVTSGLRPGAITANGTPSDHGIGKALDLSNTYDGDPDGTPEMARFFMSLVGNSRVKQAFYDPLGSIFGGRRNSYVEGDHTDHVHVATYDKGGWLMPGLTLARNNTGRPERILGPGSGMNVTLILPNVTDYQQAARAIQNELQRIDRVETGGRTYNSRTVLS